MYKRKTTLVKIIPIILLALYTIVVGALAFYDCEVMEYPVLVLIGLIAVMLGVDIAKTIKDTALMPKGEFETVYTPYMISCVISVLIVLGCIYFSGSEPKVKQSVEQLIASIGITFTVFIGGLLGNKLATGDEDENSEVIITKKG